MYDDDELERTGNEMVLAYFREIKLRKAGAPSELRIGIC
jgi:hypothetical protein